MLLELAWRNLWRYPRRTWLNVLSIAFATVVMVFLLSFQLGTYSTMKENVLRIWDGFAQIQPQGFQDNPDLKKTIEDPIKLLNTAEAVKGITAAAPRTLSFVILANGEKSVGAALAGIDPEREVRVSNLKHSIKEGRYLEKSDTNQVVLGDSLARNLGVTVGDSVTLLGEALDGSIAADVLSVTGIFSSGTAELDRQFAEIPLARFQESFFMGKAVNTIVLSGDSLKEVTRAIPELQQRIKGISQQTKPLDVQPWQVLQPGMKAAINLDLDTSFLWYASLVIVVVFIILNTLLMSVLERTREFGVLLAIGMRPANLGVMIWLELVLLALVGLVLGLAIGSAITLTVAHYGVSLPGSEALFSQWGIPGKLFPQLTLLSLSAGPGAMAISILVAGIFPYRRVRKLEPVAAMRSA